MNYTFVGDEDWIETLVLPLLVPVAVFRLTRNIFDGDVVEGEVGYDSC